MLGSDDVLVVEGDDVRYLTVDEFAVALARVGVRVSKDSLMKQARAEFAAIRAGTVDPATAVFAKAGKPWLVHCKRYCLSHGIDYTGICDDSDEW